MDSGNVCLFQMFWNVFSVMKYIYISIQLQEDQLMIVWVCVMDSLFEQQ